VNPSHPAAHTGPAHAPSIQAPDGPDHSGLPAPAPIERVLRPFRQFLHLEASGGVVLMVATALALLWANSPWAASYDALWHTKVTVGADGFGLSYDLHHWINDGLMALFFFVVGLEIKRELLSGELASVRRAALPIAAAVGGMLVPAAIYAAMNVGTAGISGWGVPMATDIAFAIGVLALLGRRAPLGVKVFVTALAVVDDIGAVLVIALFYTPTVDWIALGFAAAFLGAALAANRLGVRRPLPYAVLGIGLWVAMLQSGVHATVAGVLLALAIPARQRIDAVGFLSRSRELLEGFRRSSQRSRRAVMNEDQQWAVTSLEEACEQVQTPLQRLEHELHPWVAFVIMPVFALANAGVALTAGEVAAATTDRITLGVALGLVLGKQVGVTLFSWLAVRLGLAALPTGVTWQHVYGASWLAGIGFTMSLFVAGLAFTDPASLARAKVGILLASVIAGGVGYTLLRRAPATAASEELDDEIEAEESREARVAVPAV
jgi:Na+:H+ antiporter, NhaA family